MTDRDWQEFLDELDRRIESTEGSPRAERLKGYREKLRRIDPAEGGDALRELVPKYGLTREER